MRRRHVPSASGRTLKIHPDRDSAGKDISAASLAAAEDLLNSSRVSTSSKNPQIPHTTHLNHVLKTKYPADTQQRLQTWEAETRSPHPAPHPGRVFLSLGRSAGEALASRLCALPFSASLWSPEDSSFTFSHCSCCA